MSELETATSELMESLSITVNFQQKSNSSEHNVEKLNNYH